MVTPALFDAYPTPAKLAAADVSHVEQLVRSTGFYQTKAKNLIGMANQVMSRFGGEVPREIEDLITLPGVGRKTANVLRSVVFDLPGLPVDTHVGRLSRRLGLTKLEDPVKVEYELNAMLPPPEWGQFSLRLILHGRRVCDARKPRCEECLLEALCPSSMLPTKKGVGKSAKKSIKKSVKPSTKKSVKKSAKPSVKKRVKKSVKKRAK
jgi:endonuclease-3